MHSTGKRKGRVWHADCAREAPHAKPHENRRLWAAVAGSVLGANQATMTTRFCEASINRGQMTSLAKSLGCRLCRYEDG